MPKNNDKLKELLEQAEQGTKAVFESENYRNYLATMSKFHSYSFRNSLLILMQKPEATHVPVMLRGRKSLTGKYSVEKVVFKL